MEKYVIHPPRAAEVPILVSVPHCATFFPEELKSDFRDERMNDPDDTDWFVHKLYDFAPEMGMTMIHATCSRWVIDLNRDPESKPLYSDGRLITGLCPTTTFKGELLYKDDRTEVESEEVQRRLREYFNPYHEAISLLLEEKKQKFGKVLLWDCHSIRQEVQSIYPSKFPDLILGDNDGFAAGTFLTEIASKSLINGGYSFENNFLFKGGYITRHYGKPSAHQHALQLEMTKVNYMDDSERQYDDQRANKMRDVLRRTFEKLITVLSL
jgi:N-formylglutamate deformylase